MLKDGQQLFYDGKYAESDKKFEEFRQKNINPTSMSIGAEAANLVGGAGTADYKPYMMDELFVSFYQLLDSLALGDLETARVVINQSYNRQQSMSREYRRLIESNKKSEIPDSVKDENAQWSAYTNIMNPALTYLAGLYFLNTATDNDDWENARLYLSRAAGMMPNNDFIKADLDMAKSRTRPNGVSWTIMEMGFAPRLIEQRIDVPWFNGKDSQIISFAISAAVPQPMVQPPQGFSLLADVDAMFLAEYNQYRVNEYLRAFAKATSNSVLQNAANDSNEWLGLTAAIYSIATTRAETRSWNTLPKRIYLMRQAGGVENQLIYIRDSSIKTISLN